MFLCIGKNYKSFNLEHRDMHTKWKRQLLPRSNYTHTHTHTHMRMPTRLRPDSHPGPNYIPDWLYIHKTTRHNNLEGSNIESKTIYCDYYYSDTFIVQ
jgi:hypothetical protein